MGVNLGRPSRPPLCHPWDLRVRQFLRPSQMMCAIQMRIARRPNKYYTDNRRRKDATEGSSLRGDAMLTLLHLHYLCGLVLS